jgi:hypothetical protein
VKRRHASTIRSGGRIMSRAYVVGGALVIAALAWSSWPTRADLAGGGRAAPSWVTSCPVSRPNGGHPAGQAPDRWYHGRGGLWTILWPRGMAPIPSGNVQRNGWLYLKVPWWRGPGSEGKVRIHGRRLDKSAPVLRADVPVGYGNSGFQASAILFPTVGCWQITGRAGRGSLTMVERVVKVRG